MKTIRHGLDLVPQAQDACIAGADGAYAFNMTADHVWPPSPIGHRMRVEGPHACQIFRYMPKVLKTLQFQRKDAHDTHATR